LLPRECEPVTLRAQELTVPPDEDCLVLKLLTLYTCFHFFMCPLIYVPFDATLNLFLFPSIREYRECNSRAPRHPLHNARERPLRRGQLGLRLSDLERCRSGSLGVQKPSSTRLSTAFRFGH